MEFFDKISASLGINPGTHTGGSDFITVNHAYPVPICPETEDLDIDTVDIPRWSPLSLRCGKRDVLTPEKIYGTVIQKSTYISNGVPIESTFIWPRGGRLAVAHTGQNHLYLDHISTQHAVIQGFADIGCKCKCPASRSRSRQRCQARMVHQTTSNTDSVSSTTQSSSNTNTNTPTSSSIVSSLSSSHDSPTHPTPAPSDSYFSSLSAAMCAVQRVYALEEIEPQPTDAKERQMSSMVTLEPENIDPRNLGVSKFPNAAFPDVDGFQLVNYVKTDFVAWENDESGKSSRSSENSDIYRKMAGGEYIPVSTDDGGVCESDVDLEDDIESGIISPAQRQSFRNQRQLLGDERTQSAHSPTRRVNGNGNGSGARGVRVDAGADVDVDVGVDTSLDLGISTRTSKDAWASGGKNAAGLRVGLSFPLSTALAHQCHVQAYMATTRDQLSPSPGKLSSLVDMMGQTSSLAVCYLPIPPPEALTWIAELGIWVLNPEKTKNSGDTNLSYTDIIPSPSTSTSTSTSTLSSLYQHTHPHMRGLVAYNCPCMCGCVDCETNFFLRCYARNHGESGSMDANFLESASLGTPSYGDLSSSLEERKASDASAWPSSYVGGHNPTSDEHHNTDAGDGVVAIDSVGPHSRATQNARDVQQTWKSREPKEAQLAMLRGHPRGDTHNTRGARSPQGGAGTAVVASIANAAELTTPVPHHTQLHASLTPDTLPPARAAGPAYGLLSVPLPRTRPSLLAHVAQHSVTAALNVTGTVSRLLPARLQTLNHVHVHTGANTGVSVGKGRGANSDKISNSGTYRGDSDFRNLEDSESSSTQIYDFSQSKNSECGSPCAPMPPPAMAALSVHHSRPGDRWVAVDVDGTVTRSDVLGVCLPLAGVSWEHAAVVELLCALRSRGYRVLYLTARAATQLVMTKRYLATCRGKFPLYPDNTSLESESSSVSVTCDSNSNTISQNGDSLTLSRLPLGPVVTSGCRMWAALSSEVIHRTPHIRKIHNMQMLQRLYRRAHRNNANENGNYRIARPEGEDPQFSENGTLGKEKFGNRLVLCGFPTNENPYELFAVKQSQQDVQNDIVGHQDVQTRRQGEQIAALSPFSIPPLVASDDHSSPSPRSSLLATPLVHAHAISTTHTNAQTHTRARARSLATPSAPSLHAPLSPTPVLWAGLGNRPTDNRAYTAVGIHPTRIFCINPKGNVNSELWNSALWGHTVRKVEQMLEDFENSGFRAYSTPFQNKQHHSCICHGGAAGGDGSNAAMPDVHVDVAALMLLVNAEDHNNHAHARGTTHVGGATGGGGIARGRALSALACGYGYGGAHDVEWQHAEFEAYGCGWWGKKQRSEPLSKTPDSSSAVSTVAFPVLAPACSSISRATLATSPLAPSPHCRCPVLPLLLLPLPAPLIATALKQPSYLSLLLAAEHVFPIYTVRPPSNEDSLYSESLYSEHSLYGLPVSMPVTSGGWTTRSGVPVSTPAAVIRACVANTDNINIIHNSNSNTYISLSSTFARGGGRACATADGGVAGVGAVEELELQSVTAQTTAGVGGGMGDGNRGRVRAMSVAGEPEPEDGEEEGRRLLVGVRGDSTSATAGTACPVSAVRTAERNGYATMVAIVRPTSQQDQQQQAQAQEHALRWSLAVCDDFLDIV